MTARRARTIAIVGLLSFVALGGFLVASAKRDPFGFLLKFNPTIATPDLGFSLSPDEQKKSSARVRLFLFQQSPKMVKARLQSELTANGGWKPEIQDQDFQTFRNKREGRAVMFGTGMPTVLMSGPPEKTPTCYVVTVEASGLHVEKLLRTLGF